MAEKLYGSIEAGGTKFIVAVAGEDDQVIAQERVKTEDPQTTVANCVKFFKQYDLAGLGIGTFGPIDINPNSPTFGYIKKTPKPGWSNFDLQGEFERQLQVPVKMTTDVNASVYGEYIARGRRNDQTLFYVTIGTGIGGGMLQAGKFIGLNNHPELGHMTARKHPDDDYAGGCPFHGDRCFEGLAAGPTLEGRTGIAGEKLPRDHQVFKFIRYYVAQLLFDVYLTTRADVLIVGGSVLNEADMPEVRRDFAELMNGYLDVPDLEQLIVRPAVADNGSATLGDFELAKLAAK